jgi:4'-phosphopantetheinyl transferase
MLSPAPSELCLTIDGAVQDHPSRIAIAGTTARLWVVELDCSPAAIREASTMLPASELARCESVIDPRRRCRLLVARATLRQILAAELEARPERIEILRGDGGRPVLASPSELSFSLSHAGSWAAIALSDARSIGVDIELSDRHIPEGLMRRALSPAERTTVLSSPQRQRSEACLAHWTAKEAAAKVLGGLYGNLGRLELRDGLTAPRLVDRRLQSLEVQPLRYRELIGAIAATNDPAIHRGS